jgi:hypothetical protein
MWIAPPNNLTEVLFVQWPNVFAPNGSTVFKVSGISAAGRGPEEPGYEIKGVHQHLPHRPMLFLGIGMTMGEIEHEKTGEHKYA